MQRRVGKCETDKLVRAIGLLLAWQNLRCACCLPLAQARLLGANGQGVHFRLAYLPNTLASIFSSWHMDTQRPFCQPPALLTSCMPTCERLTPQAPAGGLHDVKDAAGCAIGEHKCYVRIIRGKPTLCGICRRSYPKYSRLLKCKRSADECLYCHHEDHFSSQSLPPCRRGQKKKGICHPPSEDEAGKDDSCTLANGVADILNGVAASGSSESLA